MMPFARRRIARQFRAWLAAHPYDPKIAVSRWRDNGIRAVVGEAFSFAFWAFFDASQIDEQQRAALYLHNQFSRMPCAKDARAQQAIYCALERARIMAELDPAGRELLGAYAAIPAGVLAGDGKPAAEHAAKIAAGLRVAQP